MMRQLMPSHLEPRGARRSSRAYMFTFTRSIPSSVRRTYDKKLSRDEHAHRWFISGIARHNRIEFRTKKSLKKPVTMTNHSEFAIAQNGIKPDAKYTRTHTHIYLSSVYYAKTAHHIRR